MQLVSNFSYFVYTQNRDFFFCLFSYICMYMFYWISASFWGEPNANQCAGQTKPLLGNNYPGGPHPAELLLEKVLSTMLKPVYALKVTTLSQLRKDGHPSVYGHGGHRDMDCSHWCLPGVPDTWNELLYAALIVKN